MSEVKRYAPAYNSWDGCFMEEDADVGNYVQESDYLASLERAEKAEDVAADLEAGISSLGRQVANQCNLIEQQEQRVSELEAEIDSLRGSLEEWQLDFKELEAENAELKAQAVEADNAFSNEASRRINVEHHITERELLDFAILCMQMGHTHKISLEDPLHFTTREGIAKALAKHRKNRAFWAKKKKGGEG
jgi:TolA-binding protein